MFGREWAVVLHTVVQKDRCAENVARGKDTEVEADYITSPGTVQQVDVSDHRKPSP